MLPPHNRMRRPTDFTAAVRSGRRVGGRSVVVHLATGPIDPVAGERAPLVGLVVSKAVGGSVVRHRVARQLRAQMSQRVTGLPSGSATVVRALPAAASASSAALGFELDRALGRLLRPAVAGTS